MDLDIYFFFDKEYMFTKGILFIALNPVSDSILQQSLFILYLRIALSFLLPTFHCFLYLFAIIQNIIPSKKCQVDARLCDR